MIDARSPRFLFVPYSLLSRLDHRKSSNIPESAILSALCDYYYYYYYCCLFHFFNNNGRKRRKMITRKRKLFKLFTPVWLSFLQAINIAPNNTFLRLDRSLAKKRPEVVTIFFIFYRISRALFCVIWTV